MITLVDVLRYNKFKTILYGIEIYNIDPFGLKIKFFTFIFVFFLHVKSRYYKGYLETGSKRKNCPRRVVIINDQNHYFYDPSEKFIMWLDCKLELLILKYYRYNKNNVLSPNNGGSKGWQNLYGWRLLIICNATTIQQTVYVIEFRMFSERFLSFERFDVYRWWLRDCQITKIIK